MRLGSLGALELLAQANGVHTAYQDIFGRRHAASPEALTAVLQALGCPLPRIGNAAAALRSAQEVAWRRGCEPVAVAWDGRPPTVAVWLPGNEADRPLACELIREDGSRHRWRVARPAAWLASLQGWRRGGYRRVSLALPGRLPWGYHQLTVSGKTRQYPMLLIAAPRRAYAPPRRAARSWGLFLPLYAARSRHDWGTGSFAQLAQLAQWVGRRSGGVIATLPLLAAFLDETFEPSPYVPISRLFWNELYLDVPRVPEMARCPSVQRLIGGQAFQRHLEALRGATLVDYQRVMAVKRQALERLAAAFFRGGSSAREQAFRRFLADHPLAEDYARFRAVSERRRTAWTQWPQPLQDGRLQDGDFEQAAYRYHLYVQWNAHEQLAAAARAARRRGPGLYLDVPLGVHARGFDVWRERRAFAPAMRVGAPPDALFTDGQDWGFPPLHPEAIRADGYRYLRACLRHHLRYAGVLRLDHVMSLHRLFWIPPGGGPSQGVYVRYRAEELYAILSLESHRAKALVVGEDLGTVPPGVREAMRSHAVHRMFVVQYELPTRQREGLRRIPADAVASLNTHDMPTFAGAWHGRDIDDRVQLGVLQPGPAEAERVHRARLREHLLKALRQGGWLRGEADDVGTIFRACLAWLGASDARIVLINVEDLWLETQPQNVPGTWRERPNWQRRTREPFEAWSRRRDVLNTLHLMDRWRHRKATHAAR